MSLPLVSSTSTDVALPQAPSGITGQGVQNQSFYQTFNKVTATLNSMQLAFSDYQWSITPFGLVRNSSGIKSITYPNGTLTSKHFIEASVTGNPGDNIILGLPFIDLTLNTINLTFTNPANIDATSNSFTVIVRITTIAYSAS